VQPAGMPHAPPPSTARPAAVAWAQHQQPEHTGRDPVFRLDVPTGWWTKARGSV
jgi:hypothetical protein